MSSVRITVGLCLAFIAIVVGMFVYSVTRPTAPSPEALAELGVVILPTPRDIGPFELTDHQGQTFNNDALREYWSFLFFGFTNCPDICPTSMAEMARAERELLAEPERGAPFRGVLVSVDPERDDQETLARYVDAFSPRFVGVRGEREALGEFARQLNATFAKLPGEGGGYEVDHSANIVIINPRGHYAGFIKMPHQADTIAKAYRALRETL